MIKAFFKRRKIKLEVEKEIGDWEMKYRSIEDIVYNLEYQLKGQMVNEIINKTSVDFEDVAKDLLFEILEDPEFKAGLKTAVADSVKDRFKTYLDRV